MANEGMTKPTYSELEAELADAEKECAYWMKKAADAERVRGLLQRITEIVTENDVCRICHDRIFPNLGEKELRHRADCKFTLWLAESADIGKLDAADESGKVNRVEEKMTAGELVSLSVRLLDIRERIEALPPDETVFFRHFAPSVQDEMTALIGKLLSPHSSMAEPSPYKGQVTGSSPVAATISLNTLDNGVKPCEYCARYNDRCCHCRNANGMDMKDLLSGSAETGGEKAAPISQDTSIFGETWHSRLYNAAPYPPNEAEMTCGGCGRTYRARRDGEVIVFERGYDADATIPTRTTCNCNFDAGHEPTCNIVAAHKRISDAPAPGSEVRSGVEGAHEGMTADEKAGKHQHVCEFYAAHYGDHQCACGLRSTMPMSADDKCAREPEKQNTADKKAELPREHQCVSANDCPLCDEYVPPKSESREPEKLNNATDPLDYFLVTYGFDGNNHARQMLISCWAAARQYERKQAAESSLSSPSGKVINVSGEEPAATGVVTEDILHYFFGQASYATVRNEFVEVDPANLLAMIAEIWENRRKHTPQQQA